MAATFASKASRSSSSAGVGISARVIVGAMLTDAAAAGPAAGASGLKQWRHEKRRRSAPTPSAAAPRKIAFVDVSVDGGRMWQRATLDEPVLPKCHTRFRLPWHWSGAATTIMRSAADETGDAQPTRAEPLAVRGPGTQYHFNNIRAWVVAADGRVTLATGAA